MAYRLNSVQVAKVWGVGKLALLGFLPKFNEDSHLEKFTTKFLLEYEPQDIPGTDEHPFVGAWWGAPAHQLISQLMRADTLVAGNNRTELVLLDLEIEKMPYDPWSFSCDIANIIAGECRQERGRFLRKLKAGKLLQVS
jgi:hypothetical protein